MSTDATVDLQGEVKSQRRRVEALERLSGLIFCSFHMLPAKTESRGRSPSTPHPIPSWPAV